MVLAQQPAGPHHHRASAAQRLVWAHHPLSHGRTQELRRAHLRFRVPRRDLPPTRIGGGVEHDSEQIGARHAIDHGVMALGDQRPVLVLEALHHPHLPQWLGPVERLAHDPTDQVAELLVAAGGGESGVADVVPEVEVDIVDPHWPVVLERNEPHLLAVARHLRQLGRNHGQNVGELRRRSLEDGDRGNVHRTRGVLDVEERRIQRTQALHGNLRVSTASVTPPYRPPEGADRRR